MSEQQSISGYIYIYIYIMNNFISESEYIYIFDLWSAIPFSTMMTFTLCALLELIMMIDNA